MSEPLRQPTAADDHRAWTGLDTLGACLFLALAAWIVLAGRVSGGDPRPMATLVLATGVMAFAARALARRAGAAVPASLVAVLLVSIVVTWPQAIHPLFGLLGYANANGALYAVGTGAAGLVVLRSSWPGGRIAAGVAAVALALLPWASRADAGAGSAAIILGVTLLLLVSRRPHRWLVPVAMVVAAAAMVATVVAGLVYDGDGEGEGGWRLSERRLVLWSDALDMVRAEPLTGVGPGRFAAFSPTAAADSDASWAHQEPLSVAAETGLPGMLLLLAIVAWAFVWLDRGSGVRGATLATVVLAAAFTHATIDYVWHNPAVPMALAVVVGSGATAQRRAVP